MNWQIIGHKNILEYLENAMMNGRLAHAYLFYGPHNVGKKEVAKKFVQNLLCYEQQKQEGIEQPKIVPCEECEFCLGLKKGTYPDYYVIKKESAEKNIAVEQIRELKNKLAAKSFFKSYKVAVIWNAEQLSLAAANALLKVLEEPLGKKTIIILIAENLQTLPKTILSRTQRINFLPVNRNDIYEFLSKEKGINRDLAWHLATYAEGKPGEALLYLKNPDFWQKYTEDLNTFLKLLAAKKHERLKFVETVLSGEKSLVEQTAMVWPLLNFWQTLFRDLILFKMDLSDKIINSKMTLELGKIAPYLAVVKLQKIIMEIDLAKSYLKQNANVRLVMENLLLSF
jgi:DNA polymerase-3 subunit delta'